MLGTEGGAGSQDVMSEIFLSSFAFDSSNSGRNPPMGNGVAPHCAETDTAAAFVLFQRAPGKRQATPKSYVVAHQILHSCSDAVVLGLICSVMASRSALGC